MRILSYLVSFIFLQARVGPAQQSPSASSATQNSSSNVSTANSFDFRVVSLDNTLFASAGSYYPLNFFAVYQNGAPVVGARVRIGNQISLPVDNDGLIYFEFTVSTLAGIHSYNAELVDADGNILSHLNLNLGTRSDNLQTINLISQVADGQTYTDPANLVNPVFEGRDAFGNLLSSADLINGLGAGATSDAQGLYPVSMVGILNNGDSGYHFVPELDSTGAYTRAKLVFTAPPLPGNEGLMFYMNVCGGFTCLPTNVYVIRH